MKYSTLIRKLVRLSYETRYYDEDIASHLKDRCVDGIDIIRMTLMDAVCDPRFRLHAGATPSWRKTAQSFLESLATSLMATPHLTEENAIWQMEEALDKWLEDTTTQLKRKEKRQVERKKEDNRSEGFHQTENALKDLLSGVKGDDDEDDDGDEPVEIPWGKGTAKIKSRQREEEIENNFFHHVPASLIRLAKIIGRASDGIMSKSSSFSAASISDIAGITTGSNLESLLPSELALLSDRATENIFYKKYVTKSLQVFASNSQSEKGEKHHDGPIIICLDTSGSMAGEPIIVATALTMAICIIAQRVNRQVLIIRYSDSHELYRVRDIGNDKQEIADFLNHVEMGGNNENDMFRWLFTDILSKEKAYDSADILCISDFGWSMICADTYELILDAKKNGMVFYGLQIGEDCTGANSMTYEGELLGVGSSEVIDQMWEYKDGQCRKKRADKKKQIQTYV